MNTAEDTRTDMVMAETTRSREAASYAERQRVLARAEAAYQAAMARRAPAKAA